MAINPQENTELVVQVLLRLYGETHAGAQAPPGGGLCVSRILN